MLALLDGCFAGLNIADFQYGKSSEDVAWPAFSIHSEDPAVLDALPDAVSTPELNVACAEGEHHALVAKLRDLGYTFVALGSDGGSVRAGLMSILTTLRAK